MKDCTISGNGNKLLHELSFPVLLEIVATVVSLVDSLGGAMRKLSNKRNSISLKKQYLLMDKV